MDQTGQEHRYERDSPRTTDPDDGGQHPFFVVQEHRASRLHHDLRLMMDGTLKSWAVPKGVPDVTMVKRLAVRTEDHSLSYGSFEGTIPEGHYGAGTVTIYDRGELDVKERDENKIVFEIRGSRLNGTYALIKFKGQDKGDNWLLMRTK